MKTLKVGVIGTGGIARAFHLPTLSDTPGVELVAVCDIVREKAVKAAEDFKASHVFEDYRELLELEELDAVSICTPNYLHSIIAVAAFEKGKHVICEKPDAVSVEEALKMKAASEKAGKLLMVMRNNRYDGKIQFLKKYIAEGNLGEIYAAKCGWVRRRGIPGKGGWFTTKAQSGGGPLIDLGVHMIDVSIWLMGSPTPVSVTGSTYCKFANEDTKADSANAAFGESKAGGTFDVEDLAMGFIKFDNGASLAIEFSWASNIESEDKYVELLGTKAGAKYHSTDSELKLFGEAVGVTTDIKPNLGTAEAGQHARYIRHFIACIRGEETPIFVPQQGVDMIKILTAIYQSAQTGSEVKL